MDFLRIKEFMKELTDTCTPGNALVIYRHNKEIFRCYSGYSDTEEKIPIQGGELYNIYSCSKPITVTAAMKLYEQGKFSLDDSIYEYIPEYKDISVRCENGDVVKAERPITIRHLFTMSAGFDYDLNGPGVQLAKKVTDGKVDTVTLAKCLAKAPLQFQPGERYAYSLCHDVLAAVVEVISGQRFSNYVNENIFAPLEIDDAFYSRPKSVQDRLVSQYEVDFDRSVRGERKCYWNKIGKVPDYILGENHESGGAGLAISAESYAKFTGAMACMGKCPNGEQILLPETINLMRTNQIPESWFKNFWQCERLSGYGYGLGVRTLLYPKYLNNPSSIGEFGWDGAAGAYTHIDPQKELGFFYAQQLLPRVEDVERIQFGLRKLIYDSLED